MSKVGLSFIVSLFILVQFIIGISSCKDQTMPNMDSADKLRAGYMGTWNLDVLDEMSNNGMNTASVSYTHLTLPTKA